MKKGRILRTKLATIAMLLSVGASTFVAPVASLAEVTTQSMTETVKESTVDSSSKEENKSKKKTEESTSQTNNSVEKEVVSEETTVEVQPVERIANQALTADQIQQLAEREGAAKYNTAGLSNEEIEQLGLAIFGEYQPAGASVTMKNDNGEEVNIPFKMKAMTREIASSNSFNMNYVLTGHGTTSRYPIMNHHYIGSRYAYCIDPNVLFGNGSDYTSKPMDISNQTYKNINDVMNFGAKDASDDVASGYTQLLVWSRLGWDVTEVGGIGNLEGFKAYQADVESKMQQWYRPASFDGQTINLKVGESTVLIDNNNSIDLMNITANNTGVEVTKDGNKLTLKATSDSVKSGNVKLRKTSPLAETALIWSSPNEQTVATAGNLDPSSTDTNVKVNIIKEGKLTLKKTDENGKAIAGAKFNITPTLPDGKKQATKVYTTDANGNFETPVYKEGTKIDYEEIATIAGHYIDPATSKGTIVIKDGGNELVVKNPTVKIALDSQASNADGAQFSNPTKDQKLREELMVDGQQLPTDAKLRSTTDLVEFGTGKQLGEESLEKVEEFTAKQAKFVHNIYYDFDATGMNGKKAVFINKVEYYNPSTKEWELAAKHDDLNNEQEAIQFVEPKIHTEFFAFDNNNNAIKNPDPLAKVSGYDRNYYENLISGQPYQFDMSIMNKETEKPFTDPLGKEVTGTLEIVAGKDGVVTSKILAKDYYTATKETNDKADTEKDTDKADKETANSGSKVEAKATDTTDKDATETDDTAAKEENDTATEFSKLEEVTLLTGYVDVPFENLDLSQAAGKVLVAYESLSSKGTELTSEKNIDEVKQQLTVNVPETPVKPTTPTKSIPQTWGSLSDMQKVLAAVVTLAIVGAIATVLYLKAKKEVKE